MLPKPFRVAGSPNDVRKRLIDALPTVRNPWFPTLRELRAWESSEAELYARPIDGQTIDVGPRTFTLWAACFSPTWRLTLAAQKPGLTHITVSQGHNNVTRGLLALWYLLLVLWAANLLPGLLTGDEHWSWIIWWTIVAAAVVGGPYVGHREGGKALADALPSLRETLIGDAGEDW